MITCVFHNADHDGECSAAIVKAKYPECKLIGLNYGDPIPWDILKNSEMVVMVDFSFPIEKMIYLASKTQLIWIDHHASIIKDAEKYDFNPDGVRNLDKSGCELTWEFFFTNIKKPIGVHYLGRFDVWDIYTDPNVLHFEYGMQKYISAICIDEKTCEFSLNNELWTPIIENDEVRVEQLIAEGEIIYTFKQLELAKLMRGYAFDINFSGFKAIAANLPRCNSLAFDSVWDDKKYDIMISFGVFKEQVNVSFYTTKNDIDVSALAKKFGGGGHVKASGCSFPSKEKFFKHFIYE